MKRLPGPTRERIIAAALELFSRKGYVATPVAGILERAQASSSSFCHFFKTKDALLLYVLERHLLQIESIVDRRTAKVKDPIAQVFTILDFYRRGLLATNYSCGCLVGNMTLEISIEQTHLRRAIARAIDQLACMIESRLKKAEDRFPRGTNLRALSRFILAVMQGGAMQSRASNAIDPFDASISHLQAYFRWLGYRLDERHLLEPPPAWREGTRDAPMNLQLILERAPGDPRLDSKVARSR